MLTDEELERFARHLSLPEIGMPGQEKLAAANIVCLDHGAWADTLRLALARAGVRVNQAQTSTGVAIVHDAKVPRNTVRFADATVHIGPIDYSHPASVDAAGPLAAKHVWLGATLACEVLLWLLAYRPARYWLSVEFPLSAVIDEHPATDRA